VDRSPTYHELSLRQLLCSVCGFVLGFRTRLCRTRVRILWISAIGDDAAAHLKRKGSSRQLDQVNIAKTANMTGFDHVVEVTIEQCEENSNRPLMSLQACRPKTVLAKMHIRAARDSRGGPRFDSHIEAAKQLALTLHEAGDECGGKAVIDQVLSTFEARRCIPSYDDEVENALLFDFVQEVAFQFREMESWKQCRYWAERGLGLAMRLCGYRSSRARRFQRMLEKDDFNMRTPVHVDDIMSLSNRSSEARIVWTPR